MAPVCYLWTALLFKINCGGRGGGLGDGSHGRYSGQEKGAKEQLAKEKCKAIEVKSAGTQHRLRRPSAQKLLQEGRAPKRRWRNKLAKWRRSPARNGGALVSCKARRVIISLKISAQPPPTRGKTNGAPSSAPLATRTPRGAGVLSGALYHKCVCPREARSFRCPVPPPATGRCGSARQY